MLKRIAVRLVTIAIIGCVVNGLTQTCLAGVVLKTPAGLNAGDTFRFAFVTTGVTDATSSDIGTYNAFVNSDAGGATYEGATVTWYAIGSTASVDAITNIGTNPGVSGIYLPDGTLVTSSDTTSGLWSGLLINPIDENLDGATADPTISIWTGTDPSGTGNSNHELGTSLPVTGLSSFTNSLWIAADNAPSFALLPLYGISTVLTVPQPSSVPEPSSAVAAMVASAFGLVLALYRNRKEQWRQRPAEPIEGSP